ncbi:ADR093Wp [Eremothecium gossypii ATCC 10895]|uniref:ADR093Wp n=1 Tax=Eremothecium gossypii (strain ATCC 10895 / CBS 109.51 / FGSC 9923 / NRRL Y-1056) TaxID=284811 RepID=Q75A27_EREGS|nr:ADR093Wp [Eremothecium gossypii ATCC 10895]AAS52013.1 ADR093Wp [Eremothecium gossypii ATCC 10895]AEY96312.1 FADR093Wp [Eremothecium gossypii FDAG1]
MKDAVSTGQNDGVSILLLGLAASGKTTLLRQLQLGNVSASTVDGLPVETVAYRNVVLSSWDPSRAVDHAAFASSRHERCKALIFVVDAADRAGIDAARATLHTLLDDCALRARPLLLLANKTDLPDALPDGELCDLLGLAGGLPRPWRLQAVSAARRTGIYPGLEWLTATLESGRSGRPAQFAAARSIGAAVSD